MGNLIFVINCGSSSIKFQLMDPSSEEVLFKGLAENIATDRCRIKHSDGKIDLPGDSYTAILSHIIELLDPFKDHLKAIGHRVVHGGEHFSSSVVVTTEVLKKIKNCADLAPLHNPVNTLGIEIFMEQYRDLPNIAVFDTAFHMSIPPVNHLYAIPYDYYKEYKIRKYGFHGTSHKFVAEKAATILEKYSKLIIAHLGNGCSICAVKDGKSVDTSMGFTPLEGLMMGTRSGDIDPSVVCFLSKKLKINAEEATGLLNKKSGLLGVSGISGDMRLLEEKALENEPRALLAIEIFCYRLAKYIYSYQVPLGGCDALIFTGGIGENSSYIREKVVNYLPGFSIDSKAHKDLGRGETGIISGKNLPVIAVIPTNEELLIARDADRLRRTL